MRWLDKLGKKVTKFYSSYSISDKQKVKTNSKESKQNFKSIFLRETVLKNAVGTHPFSENESKFFGTMNATGFWNASVKTKWQFYCNV